MSARNSFIDAAPRCFGKQRESAMHSRTGAVAGHSQEPGPHRGLDPSDEWILQRGGHLCHAGRLCIQKHEDRLREPHKHDGCARSCNKSKGLRWRRPSFFGLLGNSRFRGERGEGIASQTFPTADVHRQLLVCIPHGTKSCRMIRKRKIKSYQQSNFAEITEHDPVVTCTNTGSTIHAVINRTTMTVRCYMLSYWGRLRFHILELLSLIQINIEDKYRM